MAVHQRHSLLQSYRQSTHQLRLLKMKKWPPSQQRQPTAVAKIRGVTIAATTLIEATTTLRIEGPATEVSTPQEVVTAKTRTRTQGRTKTKTQGRVKASRTQIRKQQLDPVRPVFIVDV